MYVLCKRLRVVLCGNERISLRNPQSLSFTKACPLQIAVWHDHWYVHRLPPRGSPSAKVGSPYMETCRQLEPNRHPRVCWLLLCPQLPLECSTPGPGEVNHAILAGNRGQTRSGRLLLTRPLLGCHLTEEDV